MLTASRLGLRSVDRTALLLAALKDGRSHSAPELLSRCGLSGPQGRNWLDTLVDSRLLVVTARTGRGAKDPELALRTDIGVLTVDIGDDRVVVDVRDLGSGSRASISSPVTDASPVPGQLGERVRDVLVRSGLAPQQVRAVVVGLPSAMSRSVTESRPTAHDPVQPWLDALRAQHLLPPGGAVLENRAGLLALGRAAERAGRATVLQIEIGLDIDAGIVTDGAVVRGADRVAGALSHVVVPDQREIRCRCGNLGCLTTVAGGAGLARLLDLPTGIDTVRRLLALERSGDVKACAALRTAGWQIGTVLRSCAMLLDPDEIAIGGALGTGSPNLRWGISEIVESEATTARHPVVYVTPDDELFARGAAVRALHAAFDHTLELPAAVAG